MIPANLVNNTAQVINKISKEWEKRNKETGSWQLTFDGVLYPGGWVLTIDVTSEEAHHSPQKYPHCGKSNKITTYQWQISTCGTWGEVPGYLTYWVSENKEEVIKDPKEIAETILQEIWKIVTAE